MPVPQPKRIFQMTLLLVLRQQGISSGPHAFLAKQGKVRKGERRPLGFGQSKCPCTPPVCSFQSSNTTLMHLGRSKRAPGLMVYARTVFPAPGSAQPAFPSARLSQGQMTSFSVVWSPDSPAPVSSESIRQGPLSVGISILIWKKLWTQMQVKRKEGRAIPT